MDLRNTEDGGTPATETTGFRDPAAAIFSMYLTRVKKFDDENVENWKGGAEGVLVFVRFYSRRPRQYLEPVRRTFCRTRSHSKYSNYFLFSEPDNLTVR